MAGAGDECGWPASPLWDYATDLYARPGVRAACLALQERRGADVNLLLLACWLGAAGLRPDELRLSRLREVASRWQRDVVAPLRLVRGRLKAILPGLDERLRGPLTATRERLAAVELAAERGQLWLLERAVDGAPGGSAPDPDLAAWLLGQLAPLTGEDAPETAALLAAAFPSTRPTAPNGQAGRKRPRS